MGRSLSIYVCLVCLLYARPAGAQDAAPPADPQPASLLLSLLNATAEKIDSSGNRVLYIGKAEMQLQGGSRFSADLIEFVPAKGLIVATGNVVFSSAEGRLAAERVEFNMADGTGKFHVATGLMNIGDNVDRSQFAGQEPEVIFYGELIEKLGPERYRLTRGAFTTCVQPTPRWELVSGSITINVNDYAVANNTVLRVKGVPVMYLPVIYYPLKEEERATGFLMPAYGTSSLRGQSISNAFFWAISRNQDATVFHDWFTRTGQGAGGEYRYIAGQQSSGGVRFYRLQQKEAQFTTNGISTSLPRQISYELRGSAVQAIIPGVRARGRVDYFTDVVTQQLYHHTMYESSRAIRTVEGSLSANLGRLTTSAQFQRNESFSNRQKSIRYGSTPRLAASVAPQQLFDGLIYASAEGEYAHLPYTFLDRGVVERDDTLTRYDLMPTLRAPLSRLTFLSVNSNVSYRTTYYTRSARGGRIGPDPFFRKYMRLRSEAIGPVFARIWDADPSSRSARRKHVIEPRLTVDYTTSIPEFRRTPVLVDDSDVVIGGSARFTYGLTSRFLSRERTTSGDTGQTHEVFTVELRQTYYTNPANNEFDTAYASSSRSGRPSDLSPVAISTRVSPTALASATARIEYDISAGNGLQAVSTGALLTGDRNEFSLNYSFSRPRRTSKANAYLSASTALRFLNNRLRTAYAVNWDSQRGEIVSQTMTSTYLAQCCGISMEFQNFNYPPVTGFPIPADRRINFSIVLAGLGTFSNFFGAFGGQP